MITGNIHNALRQVQEIRQRIVETKHFRGFSAGARIAGGVVALLAGGIMSLPIYPATPLAFVVGWGMVAATAFALNYGALLIWYAKLDETARKHLNSRAVNDTLLNVLVGGIITLSLIQSGAYDSLYPVWMLIFGIMNYMGQSFLPRVTAWLGFYYMFWGGYLVVFYPSLGFYDPWPMAIVFFVGEVLGGLLFYKVRRRDE